jgi:hypothetical protein
MQLRKLRADIPSLRRPIDAVLAAIAARNRMRTGLLIDALILRARTGPLTAAQKARVVATAERVRDYRRAAPSATSTVAVMAVRGSWR